MTRTAWVLPAVLALGLVAAAPALAADEPPGAPTLIMTDTPTDPARFDWLSEGGRTALADAVAKHKSGEIFAFVFAGAPGDFWAYRFVANDRAVFGLDDLARQALQACESVRRAPCLIVSVNGNDSRDAAGGLPAQPSQLADQPIEFDAAQVPFVSMADRALIAAYRYETKPKVLVVTIGTGWLWRTGANLFEATATALADCQTTYPGQTCILYAVNNRVVFLHGGPY